MEEITSLEICAGAGGQALGLEQAGFSHVGLVEIDINACNTLITNRPDWDVIQTDLRGFSAKKYYGIDLLAGGVPCPPFSKAGLQLGEQDERNLFPEVIRLTKECMPKAVMIENVRGLMDARFEAYRQFISDSIEQLGYTTLWQLLQASDFGVPQLRPRTIFVAIRKEFGELFTWPSGNNTPPPTVGETLYKDMSILGWQDANVWKKGANGIAPTIVGGSKKHGGPDLGPTRARQAWAKLGVDGRGIADEPPGPYFHGMPRLTVKMTATLQGFPDNWTITGKKTPAYRQIGNAFPPPVAKAVGKKLIDVIQVMKDTANRGVM